MKILRLLLPALFCSFLWTAPAAAEGSKQAAAELYKHGTVKYNLGEWDEAIALFRKGFEEIPDPAFLFNIAQAYRHAGNCQQAIFFYSRFLSLVPQDHPQRTEVNNRLAELESNCQKTKEIADAPPKTTLAPADSPDPVTSTPATTSPEPAEEAPPAEPEVSTGADTSLDESPAESHSEASVASVASAAEPQAPASVVLAAGVGPAFVGMGDLDGSTELSIHIEAGVPLSVAGLEVIAGGLVSLTPVSWSTDQGDGTAYLNSILAQAKISHAVMDKLSLHGGLGLGIQNLLGLDEGNGFTKNGWAVSRPLTFFNVRVALGASWQFSPKVAASFSPVVFSYSPSSDDLRDEVSSLTRFEISAGVIVRI